MYSIVYFYIGRSISVLIILLALLRFGISRVSDGVVKDRVLKKRIINYAAEYKKSLDYAFSPVDLYFLATMEEKIFNIVKEYVAKLDHEAELFFKRYIADYEDSSLLALKDSNEVDKKKYHKIIWNPIWSYRMIWRFVKDFPKIKDALYYNADSGILAKLKDEIHKKDVWPGEKDLNDSMHSILILHDAYNLNAFEVAEGNISGVLTNATLSAVHCFEIAKFAFYHNKMYTYAIEWLEVADSKRSVLNGHPLLDLVEESDISTLLEEIISEHDAIWVKELPNFDTLYQYYDKIDSEFSLTTQLAVLQSEFTKRGDSKYDISYNDFTAFSTLCKGGNLQTAKEKSELFCWYESKVHPAWYIDPQKMELHSKEPYIFQVYDFIGNNLARNVKQMAIPVVERSRIATDPDAEIPESPYAKTRTSISAWLTEHDNDKLLGLSKRIGYLTGLVSHYGEYISTDMLQIAAYATGGYFSLHTDALQETNSVKLLIKENVGDRLATFMLYLNDVEHGGKTAFTSAGVGVPPVKGSAVFWYDIKRNGLPDYRSWHAGCPVLLGEKWVANKWLHQFPNFANYKCSLNKEE